MTAAKIGIDPGVKTGIAVYSDNKLQMVESCTAIKAETFILKARSECDIELYVEDARLRTWIPENKGREVLQGVGSVKRDSQRWEEFCGHYKIKLNLVHPKNNKTKMKARDFKIVTGWDKKTNEHGRDAAMLVYGR